MTFKSILFNIFYNIFFKYIQRYSNIFKDIFFKIYINLYVSSEYLSCLGINGSNDQQDSHCSHFGMKLISVTVCHAFKGQSHPDPRAVAEMSLLQCSSLMAQLGSCHLCQTPYSCPWQASFSYCCIILMRLPWSAILDK